MKARVLLLCLAPLLVGFDLLQSPNKSVESGNTRMKNGKAEEALSEYDKAVKALPAEPGAHFNRGAALYSLSRFDEAAGEFLRATEAKTTALKASAFYNLGNSYFKTDKYDDAIAAYRRSLSLDPNDIRAKWNLELAQKKKKEADEKKKKEADKNKDQKKDDQSKNDEKKDDQNKDQKKDEQAKNDEQKNEQKKEEPKEQKKDEAKNEPQKPEKGADMKEIEAVLDSLERSPKDLEKERARLRAIRRAAPSKDW